MWLKWKYCRNSVRKTFTTTEGLYFDPCQFGYRIYDSFVGTSVLSEENRNNVSENDSRAKKSPHQLRLTQELTGKVKRRLVTKLGNFMLFFFWNPKSSVFECVFLLL